MRVLLIEDDAHLGDALKRYLDKNGFECEWVEDDRDVMLILNSSTFDIVVLDLILKYSKGEDILKSIKRKYSLPVIIMTAKDHIEDKEVCFSLGADDYIVKPFNPKELLLRINTVSKRYYAMDLVKVGDVEIDLNKKTVRKGGKLIDLTNRDWQLLELLVRNRGKVVSTETIISYIWPDGDAAFDSVRAYIKRLREALGKELIKNLKGRGYMFLD